MIIAVDFDGTCTTHEFPHVGRDIGAAPVLQELVDNGHQLILYTMRSDMGDPGDYLTAAVDWFNRNNIPLYGIQRNPTQDTWTTSPKCYAQLYIDDAALGCPLIEDDGRPYVDWLEVRIMLMDKGLLKVNY